MYTPSPVDKIMYIPRPVDRNICNYKIITYISPD